MKKELFLMFTLFLIVSGTANLSAQVRIGASGVPHTAAVLDLNVTDDATPSSNKGGLALPRVNLATESHLLNGKTPIDGMLVYHTGTALSGAGVYVWMNNKWNKALASPTIYAGSTSIQLNNGTFQRAALEGDVTAPLGSNVTTIAADKVTSAKIKDGEVKTADILDGTIAEVDLGANAVTSAKIKDGEVKTADIATGGVTTTNILDGTIATADLANGAVTAAKLNQSAAAEGQVLKWNNATKVWEPKADDNTNTTYTGSTSVTLSGTSFQRAALTGDVTAAANTNATTIATDAVTSAKIKDGEVKTADILDGTIAAADLAADAVTSAKIKDGEVKTADILDGTIAAADLAADAVTSAKIKDGEVKTADILDGTIATADLANGAVTAVKLNQMAATDGQVLKWNNSESIWKPAPDADANTIYTGSTSVTLSGTSFQRAALSGDVTAAANNNATTIADGKVTSAKIADGTIATADLAGNAVTSANIKDGEVKTADILDGTIATADLADNAVTSAKIKDGEVKTADILDGTIATADLANGAVTAQKLNNMAATAGMVLRYNGSAWAASTLSISEVSGVSSNDYIIVKNGAYNGPADGTHTSGLGGSFSAGWTNAAFTALNKDLAWSPVNNTGDNTYSSAKSSCPTNWRLPNLRELQVLYEAIGGHGNRVLGFAAMSFSGLGSAPVGSESMEGSYWSSTTGGSSIAYTFSFNDGNRASVNTIVFEPRARCVRSI